MKRSTLIPTCICGRPMEFQHGESKTFCKAPGCGVVQQKGPEGYWACGRSRTALTPILPRVVVRKGVKSRADRYKNYPKQRRRKGR